MWRPILDAETGDAVRAVLGEIDHALAEHLAAGEADSRDLTLAGGSPGLALFFSYLEAARPGSGADERALAVLGDAVDGLAASRLDPALYSGFTGVGWVIEHLTREFFEADDDLTDPIDDALARLLSDPGTIQPYELMRGVLGFGTYLLERLPHPRALELLPRVVDFLDASREESPAGFTWLTRPEWMPPWQVASQPEGCYNVGLAHGVPGVLAFVAAAHRAGVADPRLPALAEGTVGWLLAQRLPGTEGSAFPAFVVPGAEPQPTRTSWCYGDLGISVALLAAARSFGRDDWEREALALARLAAGRSEGADGVIDTGLCHGTAGNAHLFLRLYRATGDLRLRDAALAGIRRTLELRRPGEGLAGYSAFMVERGDRPGAWRPEPGFLMGVSGVGLALLAAASDVEPAWDRAMLVSIPPLAELPGEGPPS